MDSGYDGWRMVDGGWWMAVVDGGFLMMECQVDGMLGGQDGLWMIRMNFLTQKNYIRNFNAFVIVLLIKTSYYF